MADLGKSMFRVGEVWRKSRVLHRSYEGASLARALMSYLIEVSNKRRGKLLFTCTKLCVTSYYITDRAVDRLQSNSKIPLW